LAALRTLRFVLDTAALAPFVIFLNLFFAMLFLLAVLPTLATLRWMAPTTLRAAFTEAISA
jgi:hypothetical protein